jgi:hypothetical protein
MDGVQPQQVRVLIRWLKEGPPGAIPVSRGQQSLGSLRAITWEDAGDRDALACLATWHSSAFAVVGAPVAMTPASVRRWLVDQILEAPERALFWIRNVRGEAIGHVGLSGVDFARRTVAVRDLVCGVDGNEDLAAEAVAALCGWARDVLGMEAEAGPCLAAA